MAESDAGGALTIVGHTDDDLLFINPQILHDIEAGRPARTVFTTAGEAGEGSAYWGSLERGIFATYAQMAGVANSWSPADSGVTAGFISVHTLTDAPHVSVVFLRLPDGLDGGGTAAYGFESLAKLWDGGIEVIHSVDGVEWYTRDEVIDMLVQLMKQFEPTTVRTADWTTDPDNLDDHSDHFTTALFTRLANERYTAPHTLIAYEGYPIRGFDQNVFDDDLAKKIGAFVTFSRFDKFLCVDPAGECPPVQPYDIWLGRQYVVAEETTDGD